jgi:hypothetical protein
MINREHYLEQIRGFYDSDLIKIIVGVRRCGKSIIMEQIMQEIKEKTDNIVYLNFEDDYVIANIYDSEKLIEYVEKNRKNGKCYIFLDEIHEVKNWNRAVKTLRLHNNSVFITGSNSKILSKEYTDAFSGRYVSFRVRPFVYKEILEYTKELKKDCSISDYIIWGGFPKRFELEEKDMIKYLTDLNESIVVKDLIMRFDIKNEELFKRIVNYILMSNSRIFSSRSIEGYLKNEHIKGSINTIIKYLGYLEKAYVINRIKPYSNKTKSELSYYFKIYDEDVSFNSLRCLNNRYDLTHNLENIVYNELIYMGYNLKVLNKEDDDKEIDFIATKDGKEYYIQVAYSVLNEKAYEREFGAFATIDNTHKKILITNDDIDYSTSAVIHIKLKDFLVSNSLDEF